MKLKTLSESPGFSLKGVCVCVSYSPMHSVNVRGNVGGKV